MKQELKAGGVEARVMGEEKGKRGELLLVARGREGSGVDDLRPPGAVQVRCSVPGCGWEFWLSKGDARLLGGPFYCDEHDPNGMARVMVRDPGKEGEWPAGVQMMTAKEGGAEIVKCPACGGNAFRDEWGLMPHCRRGGEGEEFYVDCRGASGEEERKRMERSRVRAYLGHANRLLKGDGGVN